jgi:hypothetical protein
MGIMGSLFLKIHEEELCGSCRFFTGDHVSGYIRGKCQVDGNNAHVEKKPCNLYEAKQRKNHEN